MALQLTASSRPPYAGPPLPPDEDERVGALRTLHIEEGQADPVLDSLCNLVCSLLKVRIAGARPAPECVPVRKFCFQSALNCAGPSSWRTRVRTALWGGTGPASGRTRCCGGAARRAGSLFSAVTQIEAAGELRRCGWSGRVEVYRCGVRRVARASGSPTDARWGCGHGAHARAGVSIVERDRQFYKALSTGHEKITIPRAWSFCQYTFLPKLPSVLVVEDAAQDARCLPMSAPRACEAWPVVAVAEDAAQQAGCCRRAPYACGARQLTANWTQSRLLSTALGVLRVRFAGGVSA
jgi:hypothetical protein